MPIMAKIRVFLFILTVVVVGIAAIFASYYARGYRLNIKTLKFQPSGILVVKSEPDGASVYIDRELKTATNATLTLAPGTYDVEIKKDGFATWYKRLVVEKEIVTQVTASLFKTAPSLSPITFSGAVNPTPSEDGAKIAFFVLSSTETPADKVGVYVMDTFTLPLGFSNEPKRIADGDMTGASLIFSPDNTEVLLTTSNGIFLIDSSSFTPQTQRLNVAARKDAILAQWKKEEDVKSAALFKTLPPELSEILSRRASKYTLSPDSNMILYTASQSATLPENLIKQLPGSSTQPQERGIIKDRTYIYDIKEDRNFLVSDSGGEIIRWMPTSRHLLLAEAGKVVVMDYDGTNRQEVYKGSYEAPHAFPLSNSTKLLILTNFGADGQTSNLYSLTVK